MADTPVQACGERLGASAAAARSVCSVSMSAPFVASLLSWEAALIPRLRAGTPHLLPRAQDPRSYERGAALPGLYSGRFLYNSGKCGACRYQEQLMRKRHSGAYSRAGTK